MILPEPEEIRGVNAENTLPEAKKARRAKSISEVKALKKLKLLWQSFFLKRKKEDFFPALWKRETSLFL